jgi:hypothetical protein
MEAAGKEDGCNTKTLMLDGMWRPTRLHSLSPTGTVYKQTMIVACRQNSKNPCVPIRLGSVTSISFCLPCFETKKWMNYVRQCSRTSPWIRPRLVSLRQTLDSRRDGGSRLKISSYINRPRLATDVDGNVHWGCFCSPHPLAENLASWNLPELRNSHPHPLAHALTKFWPANGSYSPSLH